MVQVQTEWKPSVNGEENSLIEAISGNAIKTSDLEELKQVLRYVMVKVGLRANNFPTDGEKQVLFEHIVTNYGNHTPQEIKLAFDMAILSKLDIEEKNVVCYENFSCLYFSTIMNAYRKWAAETHKQLKTPIMIEEGVRILTKEEKAEWMMEWKEKADNINFELIPLVFYDFMEQDNLLRLSSKEKWAYTEKATTQIKTQLFNDISTCKTNDAYIAFNKFENMEKNGFTGELKGRILNRAKRLIIYDYLKGIIQ